jgi:uncharacterized protein YrzB (UPF0473 family)
MSYKRITIPFSEAEQEKLAKMASQNQRRPKDQARYILLTALGMAADDNALIMELIRIANAVERMADNGELRDWSIAALAALKRGLELMPIERQDDWDDVKSVIASYPGKEG